MCLFSNQLFSGIISHIRKEKYMEIYMGFDIDGLDELQDGLKKVVQKGVDEVNKGLDRINNPESAKAPVPTVCPNCGAKFTYTKDQAMIVCEYCGSQYKNENRSMVDSVFEFVEKQQKVAKENQSQAQERLQYEREQKAIRKAKREQRRMIRGIFKLAILGILFYIYYINQDMFNPMIRDFISQFM